MAKIDMGIEDVKRLYKELDKMREAPDKILDSTMKDFRARGPSWVGQEVAKKYNVKKSEVTSSGALGRIGIVSNGEEVSIKYSGRLLTPTHFNMAPKAPKQSYTLTATVTKGNKKTWSKVKKLTKKQRKNIGRNFTGQGQRTSSQSPIMLLPVKGKNFTEQGHGNFLPFQRVSFKRNDLEIKKTTSLPQMIDNEEVNKNIYDAIDEKLSKRLEHHMDRFMK